MDNPGFSPDPTDNNNSNDNKVSDVKKKQSMDKKAFDKRLDKMLF